MSDARDAARYRYLQAHWDDFTGYVSKNPGEWLDNTIDAADHAAKLAAIARKWCPEASLRCVSAIEEALVVSAVTCSEAPKPSVQSAGERMTPKRYQAWSTSDGLDVRVQADGPFVQYSDYERLERELKALTDLGVHAARLEEKKAAESETDVWLVRSGAEMTGRTITPIREEVLAKIDKALKHVFAICAGDPWRMSVPVNEERDSDTIICTALRAAADYIKTPVSETPAGSGPTPRCDALFSSPFDNNDDLAWQTLARQLERELARSDGCVGDREAMSPYRSNDIRRSQG